MDLTKATVGKDWQGELYIDIPNAPTRVYLKNLTEQKESFEDVILKTQESLDETHSILAKIESTPEKNILSDGNLADKPVK